MMYNELVNEVLNIEAVEQSDLLDIVSNNLDASLSYEIKSKLFNLPIYVLQRLLRIFLTSLRYSW